MKKPIRRTVTPVDSAMAKAGTLVSIWCRIKGRCGCWDELDFILAGCFTDDTDAKRVVDALMTYDVPVPEDEPDSSGVCEDIATRIIDQPKPAVYA